MLIGRTVLVLLVGIHWVLPFTPVNPHEETRILIAGILIGPAFFLLTVRSYIRTAQSFAAAAGLLALVIGVSATTGASPPLEGAGVKLLFLAGLGWGLFRSSTAGPISPGFRPHRAAGHRLRR